MPLRFVTPAVLLLALACASAPRTTAPRTGDVSASGTTGPRAADPELHALLDTVPLDAEADAALDRYELAHLGDFMERVAAVAEDARASTAARYNAVRLIGERRTAAHLPALHAAASAPDPRVRAAVVVAAGQIMEQSGEGRSLLEQALADPAPAVQAKALEVLGTSDLPLLRAFVARAGDSEVAGVARALLRVAEERGAPLAADRAGVLRRTLPEGITLEFRPVRRWPEWDAALGTVTVTPAAGAAFTLDSIEVARDVVPVFFSPEARYAVYERARHIYVRDLETGETRTLGPGLAPRPLPFASDFVFVRELPGGRADLPDRIRIRYEVLRAPFAPGGAAPVTLGSLGAFSRVQSGGISAVRWMQVQQEGTVFTLAAEGMESFRLPDPFQTGSLP